MLANSQLAQEYVEHSISVTAYTGTQRSCRLIITFIVQLEDHILHCLIQLVVLSITRIQLFIRKKVAVFL
jgi:hypothetical protein